MSKQAIIVDNLSVAEIIAYLGGFCDRADRYIPIQRNHRLLYERLQNDYNDGRAVSVRLSQHGVKFEFGKLEATPELIAAVKSFFQDGRVSNDTIKNSLNSLPFDRYKKEHSLSNPKRREIKFQEFMDAITKVLNKKWGNKLKFARKAATREAK